MIDNVTSRGSESRGSGWRLDGPLARSHQAELVGSGPRLVVFGHGMGTNKDVWREVVRGLPDDVTALLFDLPGVGPQPAQDYEPDDFRSIASFADDLLDLLEEIGVSRCIYVGHSMAGMVGTLAAIEAPERFARLILLNASPRYLDDVDYVGGFARADVDAMLESMVVNYQAWVAGFAPAMVGGDQPAAVDAFAAGLLEMRPDITLRVARTVMESDVRGLLPMLRVPTILIHTCEDLAVPGDVARYMHAHIAGSELIWIDAKGHLPHLHTPATVRRAIAGALGA